MPPSSLITASHAEQSRPALFRRMIEAVIGNPTLYNAVQVAAGARVVDRHLGRYTRDLRPEGVVLDAGAGTERVRRLFPRTWHYISLDNDMPKLRFRGKRPATDFGVLGDALTMPIRDQSVDVIICSMVTHHIKPDHLETLFSEFWRVLCPDGRLIHLDTLAAPGRPISQLLWRIDRGAYPHTVDDLGGALAGWFDCREPEVFSFLHRYAVWTGSPLPRSASRAAIVQSKPTRTAHLR